MMPGFYALTSAWLFLLTAPVVIFYFLKLKRPRLEVPSLALWGRVMEDTRVNSPFQRFKRNLLLLLQLCLLCLLVLAAMQPFIGAKEKRKDRLPVLIDCSASMAARAEPGGASRLEAAKEKAHGLVAGLLPDQELCLVSFSRRARRLTGFTNDRRLLRDALDSIEVEDVPSDLEEALRLTQALASTASFDEVLLLSDGNLPEQADFDLPFTLNFQRLPEAGPNFGITSLNAQRSAEGDWDVFCRIEGSPGGELAATLELSRDGEVIEKRPVSLGGDEAERLAFRIGGEKPCSVAVRLVPDGFDSLSSDNVAWLDLPAARPLSVFCPPSMAACRHALRAIRGVALYPEVDGESPDVHFDMVVTDRAEDAELGGRTFFRVGGVPEDAARLVSVREGGTRIVDWRRDSPLLAHVELADLVILQCPHSAEGVGESDYENLGYEVLIHGHRGPLLLERREGDRLECHLLFHTDQSTLPYRVGFPVLLTNLVQVAMHQAGLAEARPCRTGVLPAMTLEPDRVCRVSGPGGIGREERSDVSGTLSGVPAPRVGVYEIAGGGRTRRVGASLLSSSETSLVGVDELRFSELSVEASAATLEADRPLWWPLALAAFAFLLLEWWYFNRAPRQTAAGVRVPRGTGVTG
jgi:hypothetical protein